MRKWVVLAAVALGACGPKKDPVPAVEDPASSAGPDLESLPASAVARPTNEDGKPHQAIARLLVDVAGATPDGTIRVGVHLTPDEGWHTYWRSPGDMGLPTTVDWDVPDGATASAFRWPTPERFEGDGWVSFGYGESVLLVSTLRLPETIGDEGVPIAADVTWLVCREICVPGKARLEVALPPGEGAGPFAPWFDEAEATWPVTLEGSGVEVEAAFDPDPMPTSGAFALALTLSGEGGVALPGDQWAVAPINDLTDALFIDAVESSQADGKVHVRISGETFAEDPAGTVGNLGALLVLDVGGERVRTVVEIPPRWAE